MREQIEKAEKLNAEGQYVEALEILRGMDMSFPKVTVELAKSEAGLGNFDRAAQHLEKASAAYAKLAKLKVNKPEVPAPATAPAPPAPAVKEEKPNVLEKPKFDWYQSPDQVFVSFPYKNLNPEDVHVDFQSKTLIVQVKSALHCTLQLYADISPQQSSFKVTRFKIEVILGKQTKGTTWPALEQTAMAAIKQDQLPSAYSSKKKWSGKELEEEEDAPDDDPMNTLLRKIYKDANEETRMAMKKSMQTSGGTVLTTNWNEAKDKDFTKEIKPPAGQVFKDWSGNVIAKSDS